MQQNYEKELSPEVREKMKKNLVYIGIFSVVMIFAGLTSAYIVSMGDSFWVKYNFPPAFYISTVIIVLSSVLLQLGINLAKKGNQQILKIILPITLLLGIGFAYFQWSGYGQLVDNGAYLSSKITVSNGRYGNYFQLKINGKYMEVDGNDYLVAGKLISPELKKEVSAFADQFSTITKEKDGLSNIKNYGKFTLMYKNQDLTLKENKLWSNDSTSLGFVDLTRLEEFSWHIRDGRGDFYHKGKFGKDFKVYYKGKELDYKERNLYYNGTKLSAPLQLKMDDAPDTATSYLYIITALHLLHIIGTLFYMLKMTIRSFSGDLSEYNYISVRMGAIFWHFLGLLWGYLLLFLLFIH
jgi:cytochrome c oxidase subunit 3